MGWACVLGDVEDLPELDEEFDLVDAGEDHRAPRQPGEVPHVPGRAASRHGRGDHDSECVCGAAVLALSARP